ncbi:GNAT family N-acetyltransferase [Anaerosacchariphilus polymeriproducens]|uniref:N-acetyltransferase n=1 Tax=Anaerosacchariphilus polymeriproducens TaxID=1812858 RepID=A0A371B056_9FIRM|nr:GNAT family protein [Anaerosacchariphilus polymeriproducens]RDU25186.1 N-acetyltransferase [Anaerosacchariphilus polymeriproducens]
MLINEKKITIKNGMHILLRSANANHAKEICNLRHITSEETHFMVRYPEEVDLNDEQLKKTLESIENDEKDFMITAFLDGRIIGDAGIMKINKYMKCRHRAYFGISILKEYCNQGIGKSMLNLVLKQAMINGFEQVELGVFEDNSAAIHLYEKCGFKQVGILPRAFKLKDGTYRDEIKMVCILKDIRRNRQFIL